MLSQFETNTILLLLEVCYSYLTHSNTQDEELGINILDSLMIFVLSKEDHAENGTI